MTDAEKLAERIETLLAVQLALQDEFNDSTRVRLEILELPNPATKWFALSLFCGGLFIGHTIAGFLPGPTRKQSRNG